MPEFPLLPLPAYERGDPPAPPGFPRRPPPVPSARQGQRFGPTFERLANVLANDRAGLSLRDDPASIAPERALVLEVSGSLGDFQKLAMRVDGLEFLGDEEFDFDPDEDFYEIDTRKDTKGQPRRDRRLGGRVYLAMPDLEALRQLLSLWGRWQDGEDLGTGFAPWRDLFATLRDIRPWGPTDRVSDETILHWREEIEHDPREMRRIEVEMWFRDAAHSRQIAFARVAEAVGEAGGAIIDHTVIEEIGYEAALIDVPAAEIARLAEREEVHLVVCDDIMFLRPQSSADVPAPGDESDPEKVIRDEEPAAFPPVAALLDGVPVQNHVLLDGRLEMDDPDALEALSVVEERYHGTAMASLILHGDRNVARSALSNRLYVRPVLYAPGNGDGEEPRRDRLLIDVIYRAVRRMKDGDEEGPATAPDVFLVNLSLGDPGRPFSGPMSPWARLLDYLAERYGILFLVSAGNVRRPLQINAFANWIEFEDASPQDREHAVLLALSEQKAFRTLLSPAEALNPITVGAMHDDAVVAPRGAGAVDPYESRDLPNVSSAAGLGHRKVVKPDIHLPGGREHVRFQANPGSLLVVPESGGRSGLKSASPDGAGNLDRTRLTIGTSAATALATRTAHLIFDALMDGDGGSMHTDLDAEFRAVVVKALLVHRAGWGSRAEFLDQHFGPHGKGKHTERRDNIARLLGFGFPAVEEALACAPNRATLVGCGTIAARESNLHRIPLPPSLERVTEPRALSITVAWFSPVNRRHQAYRRAKLEVSAVGSLAIAAGVKRLSVQPSDNSVLRGTVSHTRYEGDEAVAFVDDGHVSFRIYCREQGGALDQSVRYGIAVTIEAGEGIPVYDEIRARLAVPLRAGIL